MRNCPLDYAEDCPYFLANGKCGIDGDPFYECDDFIAFWDGDEEDDE